MSTRCTINFCYEDEEVCAKIYRHGDGYPDGAGGVLADLEKFFEAVESQTSDRRYSDPAYLAAKFVVWQASRNAHWRNQGAGEHEASRPLDFLSLGIVSTDPGDIEYTYLLDCIGNVRPTVRWVEV